MPVAGFDHVAITVDDVDVTTSVSFRHPDGNLLTLDRSDVTRS